MSLAIGSEPLFARTFHTIYIYLGMGAKESKACLLKPIESRACSWLLRRRAPATHKTLRRNRPVAVNFRGNTEYKDLGVISPGLRPVRNLVNVLALTLLLCVMLCACSCVCQFLCVYLRLLVFVRVFAPSLPSLIFAPVMFMWSSKPSLLPG